MIRSWRAIPPSTEFNSLHGNGCGTTPLFAARSGLVPRSALFTPEQLTEVYRCIHETLESRYPITDERKKCLESAAEQIERGVPDLDERVGLSNDKELEFADEMFAQNSGMQFS